MERLRLKFRQVSGGGREKKGRSVTLRHTDTGF
jgi:hypothetical protein